MLIAGQGEIQSWAPTWVFWWSCRPLWCHDISAFRSTLGSAYSSRFLCVACLPKEIKKTTYEKKLMERKGSNKEKRNEECSKGEGANLSDQNQRKRIKDHEKEAKRVKQKYQERRTERKRVGKHHLSLSLGKSRTSVAYFVEESERTRAFPSLPSLHLSVCPLPNMIRQADLQNKHSVSSTTQHSSQLNCTTHLAWNIKAFQKNKCPWALNGIIIHK